MFQQLLLTDQITLILNKKKRMKMKINFYLENYWSEIFGVPVQWFDEPEFFPVEKKIFRFKFFGRIVDLKLNVDPSLTW